jgi:hypothetical protein
MSSIFKKKRTKNEIEEVVVEKVVVDVQPIEQQQQLQLQQQQQQKVTEVTPDQKSEPKTSNTHQGFKSRLKFSLSRSKRDEPDNKVETTNNVDGGQSNQVAVVVVSNGQSKNDILPITVKKRWTRHAKSSPPPPPPPTQVKTNGISLKAQAPLPPAPSAPAPNAPPSPEPPPLAPKGIRSIPVSSSMTSLRSSALPIPNGLTPNGFASQPVTPATEKRSGNTF